jgi:hypothetical protein
MLKILSATLLSVLTLTACSTATKPPENAMQPSSAATQESSDAETLSIIRAWAPDLVWTEAQAGTNDDAISIDIDRDIPAGMIQTTFMTAQMDEATFRDLFLTNSREQLYVPMSAEGWMYYAGLDADGPTGTQWGFKNEFTDDLRFLIVNAHGTDCTTDPDTPPSCSRYR